ncbi:hypothetical protein WMY93_006635 [Mugilogobius chulae]|uniref:Uncharacterized protein n=1 Tax=Mugilogobius chulae TaxID=88201 RepID=A0AAW0PKE0_9GOBI
MDEPNNIRFMRLLSDESTMSNLSSDSEFYQTQILELLQTAQKRSKHNSQIYMDNGTETKGKVSTQPLRTLPLCLGPRGTSET